MILSQVLPINQLSSLFKLIGVCLQGYSLELLKGCSEFRRYLPDVNGRAGLSLGEGDCFEGEAGSKCEDEGLEGVMDVGLLIREEFGNLIDFHIYSHYWLLANRGVVKFWLKFGKKSLRA